jgi:hypothetical protein
MAPFHTNKQQFDALKAAADRCVKELGAIDYVV